jgi:RNA polymerase sigma factor (TIGR02999 family)
MHALLEAPMASAPEQGRDGQIGTGALFDQLYAELHRLARREAHRHGSFGRFGTTTLLHEAYLAMSSRAVDTVVDRPKFMAYAARVMRGLIVDEVRRVHSQKRGGMFHITALRTWHGESVADPHSLTRISEALDELAEVQPELAEIVDLKFFCGFSVAEIAAMRGISERSVHRAWEKGRLYLHHALADSGPEAGNNRGATDH